MKTKKYLQLSSSELSELENRYHYIANEYEINDSKQSAERACLKETVKIAGLRAKNKFNCLKNTEKKLFEKRQFAVRNDKLKMKLN